MIVREGAAQVQIALKESAQADKHAYAQDIDAASLGPAAVSMRLFYRLCYVWGASSNKNAYLVLIQGMEEDAHVVRPVEHCPAGHIRKSHAGEVCTASLTSDGLHEAVYAWQLRLHRHHEPPLQVFHRLIEIRKAGAYRLRTASRGEARQPSS